MSLLLALTSGLITWLRTHCGNIIGGGANMYPKNAASPQRVSVGPVVQIIDGVVQTSGVSLKVIPQGGAAGAGGGTIAYEEGVVHYIPTQAETNYASFVLIAYKTGCIPATATIITSASGVAGYAGLDWSVINAPTSSVSLTNTTIYAVTDLTNLPAIPADWLTAAGTAADFKTEIQAGLATAADLAAVKTKTDFLPSATAGAAGGVFIAGSNAATSITTALTANITGNLSGSVGSVTGAVGSVTGAVGSVTGAVGSVAAGGITAASIATDAIDADALAADAVTQILTTAMTESYAADGAAPTLAQSLFAIQQFLQERATASTTVTVKKLDGSTTAMTFTLNDATSPTSITRAT